MFKGLSQTPPAGPRGHVLTLWLLDRGRFWGLLRAQRGDDSWTQGCIPAFCIATLCLRDEEV